MSSFSSDQRFAENVAKGNLAELLFERLAVHSGWFVLYTGDQYHNPISPETRYVENSERTPDFCISRAAEFKTSFFVEVKFQQDFDASRREHTKGLEDFRVVFSPTRYVIYPKHRKKELLIAHNDWMHAIAFLRRVRKV
jgi:ADP-dependent phosphofructokinase/glucokinase